MTLHFPTKNIWIKFLYIKRLAYLLIIIATSLLENLVL